MVVFNHASRYREGIRVVNSWYITLRTTKKPITPAGLAPLSMGFSSLTVEHPSPTTVVMASPRVAMSNHLDFFSCSGLNGSPAEAVAVAIIKAIAIINFLMLCKQFHVRWQCVVPFFGDEEQVHVPLAFDTVVPYALGVVRSA